MGGLHSFFCTHHQSRPIDAPVVTYVMHDGVREDRATSEHTAGREGKVFVLINVGIVNTVDG